MTLKLIGCLRARASGAQQMNDQMNFLERIEGLSPKRLALLAAELNARLERLEQRTAEPIAVIGLGCRFPGGANDPDSFWRLLIEGRDAIVEVPADRWDLDALYDPDPDATGKMNTRWGGFLDGIDQFDPEFFGISPREAASMDPQQRVLLEVTWEALENAGLCPDGLAGSRTGVFVGVCNSDYFLKQFETGRDAADAYVATGNAHSVASGRISYLLGLQGPSLSVDTGCSASLVAVHLACQSLRAGECRAALAGGVNLILMPDTTIVLSKAHMMSPDGRCKAFDASADGFVRSEGCAVIALKRLSDAQADGDRILALIRGTASNQDGRSNGLTAPNGPSQVAVIREALANAGLEAGDVDYIEAHGTGTSLGDPIEAHALADVFGPGRSLNSPLRIGSVKTNFGHAESAAGIAGLIKAILALQHEKIPPSLHLQKLNPHIDWGDLPIAVATAPTPWTRERGQRIAGVSSFGFSGTNAHVIVSDTPPGDVLPEAQNSQTLDGLSSPELLVLSARSESALLELAGKYQQLLSQNPDLKLEDICRTAATGRSHFEYRLAILAQNLSEARERLASFRSGQKNAGIRSGRSIKSGTPGVVFMFTGQGSQYPGMGRTLFETQPVFRRELEKCTEILNPLLQIPLLEVLFADSNPSCDDHLLHQTQYTQPALFAFEYALATMWRSWGVEPVAVLGHSVGEYAAACVAGVFSLEDGLRLIAERGRLMGSLPSGGAMAAVFAPESRVYDTIRGQNNRVAIACVNSPGNVVVSGESDSVERLLAELKNAGLHSRSLVVSHAFHSELMDPILDAFEVAAGSVRFSQPLLPIVSNVTGKVVAPDLMSTPDYWRRQIRYPVRFADSIGALRKTGHSVFLEIGPHPVLTEMARANTPEAGIVWASCLKRDQEEWESLLEAVSTLYAQGIDLDWAGLCNAAGGKRVSLPTYPFQRSRYWLELKNAGLQQTREHCVQVEGASGASTTHVSKSGLENCFYEVQWREQLLNPTQGVEHELDLTADFIPEPELLVERTASELSSLSESDELDIYGEFLPRLETLSGRFINSAFLRMGWSPTSRQQFTTQELEERLKVAGSHKRLFERLLGILAEEGVLKREVDRWIVLSPLTAPPSDLRQQAEKLQGEFPACTAEVTLMARCAERLDDVLRGHCDPLQLLFPNGDFDTADALYRTSPAARAFNTALRHVLLRSIQDAPEDRIVRILEIGAGTGGTTSFLFPYIAPEHIRYTFTDVSALFLTNARSEFRDFPFATFEVLDVEKPPAAQGFDGRAFDVIIAANVLHATRDAREALRNAVGLLAPGGLLILSEATARQRWVDLTFGLTEGWWRFTDTILRPNYPLLSAKQWKALFEECGLEFVSVPAPFDGGAHSVQQAILVGRKSLPTDKTGGETLSSGFWVVLSDTKGIAEEVASLISARGELCVLVSPGTKYQFTKEGLTTIDPLRPEDFRRLYSDAIASDSGPMRGLINLWPLDETIAAETKPSEWKAGQARLAAGVLHALQAFPSLQSAEISRGTRLWLVTRGAQQPFSPEDSSVSGSCQPLQALVWGLARQVSLEYPSQFGAVIDLDVEVSPAQSAVLIWREIQTVAEEDAIVHRGGRRMVPRVVRVEKPESEPLILSQSASYLITGGLGGLGLEMTDWMAARGAGHIVLLSRREFPERSLWRKLSRESVFYETVQRLLRAEKLGAGITVAQGDVADEDQMRSLFQRFGKEDPPIKGIIHAAVDVAGRSLRDLDLESFQRVCHAKAMGGWVLERLTADIDLQFFVFFSSIAGLWGAAGLGHYAAANLALDMLAQWRRGRGLRALSINWGSWQEMRLASEADREQLLRAGLQPMLNADALLALEWLISTNRTSAIVASIDWDALRAVYEARRSRPIFSEIRSRTGTESGSSAARNSAHVESGIRVRLQRTSPAHRRDILISHLHSLVGSILGFDLSREIQLDRGLFDMGMDSLMAVELKGRLERSLNVQLPSTLTFNYPTIKALADFLLSEALVFSSKAAKQKSDSIPRPDPAKVLAASHASDDLSEDEIAHLLQKKLEEIK
jgi:microcystin synthetase protein McyG